MEDIIKNWKELPDNIDPKGRDFTFGRGGYGLQDNVWHIDIINDDDDFGATIYPLPLFISEMIELNRKWAVDENNRKIKNLLGI